MYDPSTARFLSKDPIGEAGGSPNLYVYCANDPVNQSDPSGNDDYWIVRQWRGVGREYDAVYNHAKNAAEALIQGSVQEESSNPFQEATKLFREIATKTLLGALGIDLDELKKVFNDCTLNTEGFDDIGEGPDLGGVVRRVGEALQEAVKEIGENFGGYVLGGLERWLDLPIRKLFFQQTTSGNVSSFIFLLMQNTLGLTWEALLARFQASLGGNSDVLLYTIDTLAQEKNLDRPPGESLNKWQTTWLSGDPDFGATYQKAMSTALQAMKGEIVRLLAEVLVATVLTNIITAVLGGALGKVFHAVVKIIKTGTNVASKICTSLQALIDVFKVALRGGTVGQIKPFAVAWLEASSPVLVALAAAAIGVDGLPKLLQRGMTKAKEAVWKPVDTVVHFVGKHMGKLLDPIFGKLGLLEPGVSRPLTRAVTNEQHPEFGAVKLWVAKSTLQPKLMASPETDVIAFLEGKKQPFKGKTKTCLEKVKTGPLGDLTNATTKLNHLLAKPKLSKDDARTVPVLNNKLISAESTLLSAILACPNGTDLDACDLASLSQTVDADPTTQTGKYLSSARFTYLPSVQIYDPQNAKLSYRPPLSVVALVSHVGGKPSNDATNYDAWTLYWPCKIHAQYYTSESARAGIAENRQRTGPCETAGNLKPAQGHAAYWAQSGGDKCKTCTYYAHPIIGWAGAPKRNTFGAKPDKDDVGSEHCRIPANNREHDNVGHIIASQFGGIARLAHENPNLFPQNGRINQGDFKSHEAQVVAKAAGKRLCTRIVFDYSPSASVSPYRPVRYRYYYWIDREKPATANAVGAVWPRTFANEPDS